MLTAGAEAGGVNIAGNAGLRAEQGSGMLERVVSGGQTGVDRVALDVAAELEIAIGGWCPRGRRAEDGRIPDRYPLREADSANYAVRTELNVRDSDATLLLIWGRISGGTRLTRDCAERYGRPVWQVDLRHVVQPSVELFAGDQELFVDVAEFCQWLRGNSIRQLNVAGPRGSAAVELEPCARRVLRNLFKAALSESRE